jgi:hypothetical protein
MHIRQWTALDHDLRVSLIALADAEASQLNSLLRPDYRPEPVPCIPDEEMPRESYTRQDWPEAWNL